MLASPGFIVSIVVRCRNASSELEICLKILSDQQLATGWTLELVVVDNDSSDDTVEIAMRYGAKVVNICTAEFSWGRALNRGICASHGTIIALLSVDAHPANRFWLIEMLKPFEDEQVVAVYGRQEPRRDAPIDEIARLRTTFGPISIDYGPDDLGLLEGCHSLALSNACAAIRRSAWNTARYDESLSGAEERAWTSNQLSRGFRFHYRAEARVFHSHNDAFGKFAWREWELFSYRRHNIAKRRLTLISALVASIGIIKRRISHCQKVSGHLRAKLVGVARLPPEVCFFLIVGLISTNVSLSKRVRSLFWR